MLISLTIVSSLAAVEAGAKTKAQISRTNAALQAKKIKDERGRQAAQQVVVRTPWDNGNVYDSVQELDESGVNETIRQMSRDVADQKLVYVNLAKQSFVALENGEIVRKSSSVTTGRNTFDTIQGEFQIWDKTYKKTLRAPSPKYGTYSLAVDYWMPFHKGYGLHDAPWRSVFGEQNYKVGGSHGCVNMQTPDAEWLFQWSNIGTTVFVSK